MTLPAGDTPLPSPEHRPGGRLSVCVAIATYHRDMDLVACLAHLTRQTRPADEILVVDGSDRAEHLRNLVRRRLPDLAASPTFHILASARGGSRQRNVALDHSACDVTAFLDDDAMAQPGYLEELMRLYEADTDGQLAGVEGRAIEGARAAAYRIEHVERTASQSAAASTAQTVGANGRVAPSGGGDLPRRWPGSRLRRTVRHTFRHYRRQALIHYAGDMYPPRCLEVVHDVPPHLKGPGIHAKRTLYGCVMSFRTHLAREARFCDLMPDYSFLEDFEISYRLGKDRALVHTDAAVVYHVQSASGRVDDLRRTFSYLAHVALIARTGMNGEPDVLRTVHRHLARYRQWTNMAWPIMAGRLQMRRGARDGYEIGRALLYCPEDQIAPLMLEWGARPPEPETHEAFLRAMHSHPTPAGETV